MCLFLLRELLVELSGALYKLAILSLLQLVQVAPNDGQMLNCLAQEIFASLRNVLGVGE